MALRIAIAGKGGSGKTTLSALLCRALLERGIKPLLAVDADPNSCLPERLGVAVRQTIGDMREELRQDPESVPAGVSKREWIEQLIHEDVAETPGIDLLAMGRQEGPGCYCYINSVLRECLGKLGSQYRGVVIDNEAGLEHLSRRTNGQVEVMLVVCPPNVIGARTAARIVDIKNRLGLEVGAAFLVLNPCDQPPPAELAAAFAQTRLEASAAVPTDPQVGAFDVAGRPLLELPADAPALNAVRGLVHNLAERRLL
jgi:CO dehydrogenase maturation factor